MKKDVYDLLKEKYGSFASWAVWDKPPKGREKSKENVGSMEWANDETKLLKRLKSEYVFIALNAALGKRISSKKRLAWKNFHSENPEAADYKLRYAVAESPFEGSYITDLFKGVPTKTGKELKKKLEENPSLIGKNLTILKAELSQISKKPILVALGRDTEKYLNEMLRDDNFEIVYLPHYSARLNLERYREQLLDIDKGKNNLEK